MPQAIILVNPEGEIEQAVYSANLEDWNVGGMIGDRAVMLAPPDINSDIDLAIKTRWLDAGVWKTRTTRPGAYYNWVSGAWVLESLILAKAFKAERTRRLREVDWTQLDDAPFDSFKKKEWKDYRKALRDLPDLYPELSHLDEVVWPIPPGG